MGRSAHRCKWYRAYAVRSAAMAGDRRRSARRRSRREGSANVATGLPVLDHLVGELARDGALPARRSRSRPERPTRRSRRGPRARRGARRAARAPGAAGTAGRSCPADEALASAALERVGPSRASSRTSISPDSASAALATTSPRASSSELARAAGLNLHVRVARGQRPPARARGDLQGGRRRARPGVPSRTTTTEESR